MKLPNLTLVTEKERESFVISCPELGVTSRGRTLGEADAMIQDAVRLLLEEAGDFEIRHRLNRRRRVADFQ